METRKVVASYLNKQKGFIVVSHDIDFLDKCIDHILSIENSKIVVNKGNFSNYLSNKEKSDNSNIERNNSIKKEVTRLEKSSTDKAKWSSKVESSKYHHGKKGNKIDRGYIGHKSAKMMKKSKVIENRKNKQIEEKKELLVDVNEVEKLKLTAYKNSGELINYRNVDIYNDGKEVITGLSFTFNAQDRLVILGENGSGKTTIIKSILEQGVSTKGQVYKKSNLTYSYLKQSLELKEETINEYIESNKVDEVLFKTILRKLGFDRILFNTLIENYSLGEKKKLLIAKSLATPADIYIWDEPLNYVDVDTKKQLLDVILDYQPSLIFIEHDIDFVSKVKTKEIDISKHK